MYKLVSTRGKVNDVAEFTGQIYNNDSFKFKSFSPLIVTSILAIVIGVLFQGQFNNWCVWQWTK